ncbi:MAG: ABC transporter ATP-binding protein [Halobacteriaceae archaeon]
MTLQLSAITKRYAGFELGPIRLNVDDEVLALLGPSGSGKTTLLSMIAGIDRPTAGSIRLGERELAGVPLEDRDIGLVFQDGALFPHLSARENIEYAATAPGTARYLIDLLDLSDLLDRRPAALSGGERQRVALARTLAAEPDALLLDEPLSSLDAPIRRRLRRELKQLFGEFEIPVLYVTHDQRTATAIGDRLAILRDGQIEQVGAPGDVLTHPNSPFVARFTGTENVYEGDVLSVVETDVRVRIGGLDLKTPASVPSGASVTVCIHPSRVEVAGPAEEPSLQNTFRATVDGWLNEGGEYRLDLDIDETLPPLVGSVGAGPFDRLDPDPGSQVIVTIPPDSIHLIPNPDGAREGSTG